MSLLGSLHLETLSLQTRSGASPGSMEGEAPTRVAAHVARPPTDLGSQAGRLGLAGHGCEVAGARSTGRRWRRRSSGTQGKSWATAALGKEQSGGGERPWRRGADRSLAEGRWRGCAALWPGGGGHRGGDGSLAAAPIGEEGGDRASEACGLGLVRGWARRRVGGERGAGEVVGPGMWRLSVGD